MGNNKQKNYLIVLFFLVELHDVFESETFIFLVFELCRNGELFDYLTSVVTLSEKKTKYVISYSSNYGCFYVNIFKGTL
jgi:serine/threonine protein kinase